MSYFPLILINCILTTTHLEIFSNFRVNFNLIYRVLDSTHRISDSVDRAGVRELTFPASSHMVLMLRFCRPDLRDHCFRHSPYSQGVAFLRLLHSPGLEIKFLPKPGLLLQSLFFSYPPSNYSMLGPWSQALYHGFVLSQSLKYADV